MVKMTDFFRFTIIIVFSLTPYLSQAANPEINTVANAESSIKTDTGFSQRYLQQLFDRYQRKAAYEYATQHINEMEGDPYFDYLYGVSAIDSGHASQGVFALERVLMNFPEDHVARLELARGYFILEEYPRARQEFEQVLETSPPPGVVKTTENFLAQIRLKEARYKTTSNGYIEIAVGSDSNVNSGVDADSLTLVTLSGDSLGQDDTYSTLAASYQITHPFAAGWMFNAAVTASLQKNSSLSQFDTNTATLQTGVTRLYKDSRFKASFLFQDYNLDSANYRSLSGLNFEWFNSLSQQSRLSTTFQYVVLDYPDIPIKNSDLITLGLGYTRAFTVNLSPVFFSSINIGNELAEDSNNLGALSDTERSILGLRAGLVLSFSPKLAMHTSLSWQQSAYEGVNLPYLFLTSQSLKREDDYTTVDANLIWLFSKSWKLDTKLSYAKNSSNVELNSYDRTNIKLSLNYAF